MTGVDTFAPEICHLIQRGCDMFLMTICGPSLHLNASRIQVYVAKTPAGTSTVNMMHWMQGTSVMSMSCNALRNDPRCVESHVC